jgi:hypothetical protein
MEIFNSDPSEQTLHQKITLRCMTWDAPRGYGPTEAVGQAFAQTEAGRGVKVQWDVQPLLSHREEGLPPSDAVEQAT